MLAFCTWFSVLSPVGILGYYILLCSEVFILKNPFWSGSNEASGHAAHKLQLHRPIAKFCARFRYQLPLDITRCATVPTETNEHLWFNQEKYDTISGSCNEFNYTFFRYIASKKPRDFRWDFFPPSTHCLLISDPLSQKRMARTGNFGYGPDTGRDVMSMSLNSRKKMSSVVSKHPDQLLQV